MRRTLHLCGTLPNPNPEKHSTKFLTSTQDWQGHQKQGKSENLQQTRDYGDGTTKRNTVPWVKKRTLMRKLVKFKPRV